VQNLRISGAVPPLSLICLNGLDTDTFSFSPFVVVNQHTNSTVNELTNLTSGVFFRAGVCVRCGKLRATVTSLSPLPSFLRHRYFPRGMLEESEITSCSGSCGSCVAHCDVLGVSIAALKHLMPTSHYMYRTVVTICTTSSTFNNSTFCPHSVFMCFVWISEQTAIIPLYNIN
jgi:hypothetical protein